MLKLKIINKKYCIHFFIAFLFLLVNFQKLSAQYDFKETDELIEKYKNDLGGNVSALIYKGGKIIYSKQIGNLTADKITAIASCSKWLSAALVMTFVDEGKLSLEDTIGKFLPIFTQYGKGQIKIKNCLSHTTGLESEPLNLRSLMKEGNYASLDETVNDYAKNKKLIATPGTEFSYSSIGLAIAGRIIEIISHKNFEELFQERIAVPLEMINTSFGKGKMRVNPSGSATSTANDYMNFLIMILNKGSFKGKKILSEYAVTEMQKPQTTLSIIKYAPKGAEGFNYAFGEWIQEADKNGNSTVVTSPGAFGSWPYVDNCRQYACVFIIRRFLINEETKNIYLMIKKSIDKQIAPNCN